MTEASAAQTAPTNPRGDVAGGVPPTGSAIPGTAAATGARNSAGAADARSGTVADIKPRLRGWLHTYAALTSLASGAALITAAAALRGATAGFSTAIYAVTFTLLFGTSASITGSPGSPRRTT